MIIIMYQTAMYAAKLLKENHDDNLESFLKAFSQGDIKSLDGRNPSYSIIKNVQHD